MKEKTTNVAIVSDKRSGLAAAGMVLGIIAIIGSWIPFANIFSIVIGFIGLALALPAFIVYLAKKKGSLGKSLAGLILCSLAIIIGMFMNNIASDVIEENTASNTTEAILENNVEVSFSGYIVEDKEYYETGKVEVTVKNISSQGYDFTIYIEALNDNGERIDTSVMFINKLAAGQSVKEDEFYSISTSDVDKLRNATFRVYKISKY